MISFVFTKKMLATIFNNSEKIIIFYSFKFSSLPNNNDHMLECMEHQWWVSKSTKITSDARYQNWGCRHCNYTSVFVIFDFFLLNKYLIGVTKVKKIQHRIPCKVSKYDKHLMLHNHYQWSTRMKNVTFQIFKHEFE